MAAEELARHDERIRHMDTRLMRVERKIDLLCEGMAELRGAKTAAVFIIATVSALISWATAFITG